MINCGLYVVISNNFITGNIKYFDICSMYLIPVLRV